MNRPGEDVAEMFALVVGKIRGKGAFKKVQKGKARSDVFGFQKIRQGFKRALQRVGSDFQQGMGRIVKPFDQTVIPCL